MCTVWYLEHRLMIFMFYLSQNYTSRSVLLIAAAICPFKLKSRILHEESDGHSNRRAVPLRLRHSSTALFKLSGLFDVSTLKISRQPLRILDAVNVWFWHISVEGKLRSSLSVRRKAWARVQNKYVFTCILCKKGIKMLPQFKYVNAAALSGNLYSFLASFSKLERSSVEIFSEISVVFRVGEGRLAKHVHRPNKRTCH